MCTADTLYMITLHDTVYQYGFSYQSENSHRYVHLMGLIPVTCARDQVPLCELAIFVKKKNNNNNNNNKKTKTKQTNWFELKGLVLGIFLSNCTCPLVCTVYATSSYDQLRLRPNKVKHSE